MKNLLYILVFICLTQFIHGQSFQDTIPFRDDLGLIIIPITFNGIEKEFAFDTGAQRSVAYSWPEKELKKTNKTLTINSSSGRKSKMRFYKSGVIELASRKIRGHRILNAPKNEIFSCHKVDGILGVDIIKALNWKIDYNNKLLIMFPSNFIPESTDEWHELDFRFNNNRPFVYLTRKKSQFKFLLDTGAGGFSNISKRNYNLTDTEDLPQVDILSGSFDVNGIFTSTQPKVIQFPQTQSKDVTIFPVVYYNNLKSSKIGNRLWDEQSLFMSLKKQKLYVSSDNIQQAYSGYSCAVAFQKGKMRIIGIRKDSEIWNLGVRQGDEILAINGKKFTDFCSLDQYRRSLSRKGTPFTLTLTNGNSVLISKNNPLEK